MEPWNAKLGISSSINSLGKLEYQGVWNANTNTPTITSGVGTAGHYYVVDVAGSTNIDGITDWEVGDWIIFNGSTWQKIDNSDQVDSVNGMQGAVVIGLSSVLAQDNTTGAFDLSINPGQIIQFNEGFGGELSSLSTTSAQTWELPDASGTIALTSDIVTETLAATLVAGNQTNGTNIFVTGSDDIRFEGSGNDRIYRSSNNLVIDALSKGLIINSANGDISAQYSSNSYVVEGNVSNNVVEMDIGGARPSLVFTYGGNQGILDPIISGNRTWVLPDASGTIALNSDIVVETLSETLIAGNSTGGTNLLVSNGDIIDFGGNGSISFDASIDDAIFIDVSSIDSFFVGNQTVARRGIRVDSGGTVRLETNSSNAVLEFATSGAGVGSLQTPFLDIATTWTLPSGSGTLALDLDFQTGQVYIPSNVTTTRSFNADSTTLNEIADVLASLIVDLQAVNILS